MINYSRNDISVIYLTVIACSQTNSIASSNIILSDMSLTPIIRNTTGTSSTLRVNSNSSNYINIMGSVTLMSNFDSGWFLISGINYW